MYNDRLRAVVIELVRLAALRGPLAELMLPKDSPPEPATSLTVRSSLTSTTNPADDTRTESASL
jgi:hypothetical protein